MPKLIKQTRDFETEHTLIDLSHFITLINPKLSSNSNPEHLNYCFGKQYLFFIENSLQKFQANKHQYIYTHTQKHIMQRHKKSEKKNPKYA